MNPCLYGKCSVEPYSNISDMKYLKCSCVVQYTGEFCDGKSINLFFKISSTKHTIFIIL